VISSEKDVILQRVTILPEAVTQESVAESFTIPSTRIAAARFGRAYLFVVVTYLCPSR
jgi:hypothetical protein